MDPTNDEMNQEHQWIERHLLTAKLDLEEQDLELPFSFTYDGKLFPYKGYSQNWKHESETRKLDEQRTEHTLRYTDPKTGLQVKCVAITYREFPAVEWVLYFKNTGSSDTPIIENVHALDTTLTCQKDQCVLHYSKGALCSMNDFTLVDQVLNRNMTIQLTPGGGRSSSEVLPFFNVEAPGEGVVIGIGWTGEWKANFARDESDQLCLQGGMAHTHVSCV